MAGEAGFQYEQDINKILKKNKLQPPGFRPAGSDSNAPDAMFIHKKRPWKLEIKLDMKADFGQGSLDYDTKSHKWILGGANTTSGKLMQMQLKTLGVDRLANKSWGKHGVPRKYKVDSTKFKQSDVDWDYEHFKDAFMDVPITMLNRYYSIKQTHYIQVGDGYGFYRMDRDAASLKVPNMNNTMLRIRIRIKRGGSHPIYNYRFTTAIQVARPPRPSTYNIEEDPSFLG